VHDVACLFINVVPSAFAAILANLRYPRRDGQAELTCNNDTSKPGNVETRIICIGFVG